MDKVDERDQRVARDTAPELSEFDVETITSNERRHVFEALGAAAVDPRVAIDPRLFETLGQEVVDPRGDVFDGEAEALVTVLVDEQYGRAFAARVLAHVAIEVASSTDEGTRAARVALLRCIAGFLLHDHCSRRAAALRHERSDAEP
jgi:hypothetical protein